MAKKKSTTKASARSTAGKAKKKTVASKSPKATPGKGKRTGVVKKTKSVAAKAKPVTSKAKKATGKKKVASAKSTRSTTPTVKVKRAVATKSSAKNNNTNKKAPPAKRVAKTAKVASDVEDYVKPKPMRKTRLSDEDLAMFRDMLLAKRAELVGDMTQLQNEALGRNRGDSSGDVSSMPTHMADLGSDNWEQEFTLGLIESERSLIREIDEALDRIKNRTYGICLATNKVIRKARLRAKPWAKYCIDHARKRELGLVR